MKQENALREAVIRSEQQLRQPSLGAEDVREIREHMAMLREQLSHKTEILKALSTMRNEWVREVKDVTKNLDRCNATLDRDATKVESVETRVTELEEELRLKEQLADDAKNELEYAKHAFQATLASEREQFEETNAASVEHWASLVATAEEERIAEVEALKEQLNECERKAEARVESLRAEFRAKEECWEEQKHVEGGGGGQDLEERVATIVAQKDAELAAALDRKDAEWEPIITEFQQIIATERTAQKRALEQKDADWQVIVDDFQALIHQQSAKTIVESPELVELRRRVDEYKEEEKKWKEKHAELEEKVKTLHEENQDKKPDAEIDKLKTRILYLRQ